MIIFMGLSLWSWIVWGFQADGIMVEKGYDDWFFWGFIFGPFALLYAYCQPTKEERRRKEEEQKFGRRISDVDIMAKYKELLDVNAITQEEFDILKKRIIVHK